MSGVPSIAEWFRDKGILITGASGFVGKVLVAKLLLTCPDGGNIYLLLREKRGEAPNARLNALIEQEPFKAVRKNYPERLNRLVVISGDTTTEDFGISPQDKNRLIKDVSVVFNLAANVKFDLSLRDAVVTNTKSTANLIELAKKLPKLCSLIHMSTAYCQCHQITLEERAYPSKIPPENILKLVDILNDEMLKLIEPKVLDDLPNTYSFTKCCSEDLMAKSGLPVGIARPSIVIASLKEPAPGWVDNLNGPTGMMVGAGKGVIRSMRCNGEYYADVIPCDMVANATIAFAWRVGQDNSSTPIFVNMTESGRNPITWDKAINTGRKHMIANPFSGTLWYPGGRITSSAVLHWFAVLFFHLIPAYLLDALFIITGNKPFMIKIQGRITAGMAMLQYYTTKQWIFLNDGLRDLENRLNPEDRKTFFMDTADIHWDDYLHNYILGIRKYCLKEDPSTLPRARKIFKYLYITDRIARLIFGLLVGSFVYRSHFRD